MTEEKMRQLKDLNNEIKDLQERIYNMKGAMLCDTVKGSSPRKPYAVHTIKIIGAKDRAKEKQNLEIISAQKLKILQLVKGEIEEYILTIPTVKHDKCCHINISITLHTSRLQNIWEYQLAR